MLNFLLSVTVYLKNIFTENPHTHTSNVLITTAIKSYHLEPSLVIYTSFVPNRGNEWNFLWPPKPWKINGSHTEKRGQRGARTSIDGRVIIFIGHPSRRFIMTDTRRASVLQTSSILRPDESHEPGHLSLPTPWNGARILRHVPCRRIFHSDFTKPSFKVGTHLV